MKEKIYCKSGGCSAKLGAKKLTHILEKIDKYPNSNLLVGFDSHDDASVYQVNEHQAIVSTLDFFLFLHFLFHLFFKIPVDCFVHCTP